MFASFKNFLSRHRRKFVIGGVVIGGTALLINYAHRKILELQEKEAKEFLKKAKKEQHFKSTERTCNQTILSLSKTLKETIFKILDSDAILQQIRENESDRIALWEELKVVVFAQICSLLYAGLMLVLLLRIQLNILGGYMIRDEKNNPEILTSDIQGKYLSLCQHFLENTVSELCAVMKRHSELVLKDISLKKKLTLQDIESIFWRLESSLNEDRYSPLKKLIVYLIPENSVNTIDENSDLFRTVVSETVQVLQHHEVVSHVESSIKRAFSNAVDKIAEYYVPGESMPSLNSNQMDNGLAPKEPSKIVNVTNLSMPLAKLVPILHGLYRGSFQNGSPDPWIEQFIVMEQLNKLGENVYDAFSLVETYV